MINEQEILNKINKVSKYQFKSFNLILIEDNNLCLSEMIEYQNELNFSQEEFEYVIDRSDLKFKKYNYTLLQMLLMKNNSNKINLSTNKLWELVKKNYLNNKDDDSNVLYYIFNGNKTENLNFSTQQIQDVISHAKANAVGKNNENMFLLLKKNEKENINLSTIQLFEMLQFCDFKDELLGSLLKYILENNDRLNFNDEQMVWIGERSFLNSVSVGANNLRLYREIEKRVLEKNILKKELGKSLNSKKVVRL